MRAAQTLPASYHSIGTLDIAKDQRLLVILNIVALLALGVAGWVFFRIIFWLRPYDAVSALRGIEVNGISGGILLIAAILGLTVLHVLVHEAIHGIFFWLFTRSRPRFAFKLTYAYAAAPEWYIPRNPFLITTLAPFVVMTVVGLLMIALTPPAWILPTAYVITMNAAGAVGDLMVAGWLLRQPSACFAQDRGDAVTLYIPD